MAASDFNFIPPVDPLHSVPGLTPAKDREERKRRQRAQAGKPAEQDKPKKDGREPDNGRSHSIDYCA